MGFHNPNEAKIILLTYYASSISSKGDDSARQAFLRGIKRVEKYVQRAALEGSLKKDMKVRWVAEILHEYWIGLFVKIVSTELTNRSSLPRVYRQKTKAILEPYFRD